MGSDSKTNGGSGGGGAQIPGTAKRIVQSLREMVNKNCTDAEIYAVLKDCAMDPNEAAQRLLSQDTFHEVKSKRERRKEMKETQESKARSNGTSNWGGRVGSEHGVVRSGSTNSSSTIELGKAPYRKENESLASSLHSYTSMSHASMKTLNDQASSYSDSLNADNGRQSVGTGDYISSSVPPSPRLQPTLLAANSGHVSMADIVRMGRPYNKGSQISTDSSQDTVAINSSQYHAKPAHAPTPPRSEMHEDMHSTHQSGVPEVILDEHDFDNEWPMIEQVTVATPTPAFDASATVSDAKYYNESLVHGDIANFPDNSRLDEAVASKRTFSGENVDNDFTLAASATSRHLLVTGTEGAFNGDGKLLNDKNSSDSHGSMHENQEGDSASLTDDASVAVSSATVSLQQLSIEKNEPVVPPAEDNCAVVLPNYLQALAADCSHLSFGTYRSGNASAPYKAPGCYTVINDLEETSAGRDKPPAAHLDSRNSGCHGDSDVGDMYDHHIKAADTRNCDLPVAVLKELLTQNIPEATTSQEQIPSSSSADSSLRNIQQSSQPSTFLIDSHARNISYLPNEVRPYSNSIPFDLLATTVQSLRPRDSTSFLSAQPMPARYGSTMNNQPMSVSEGSGIFSLTQPSTQVLPGGNLATGPIQPQYLPTNSYSDAVTPAMTQSYAYMPPPQQVYADSSAIHESLAGMKYNLSTHRGDVSIHSLPNSIATSGYGNFGSPTNVPGSFLHNLLNASGGAYDDVLRAQYKDGQNPILRQNDSSATWNYGPSSRTMSAVPDSGYYNILGQNQQHARYRQNQQPPQQYGGLGYPNIYNTELRITREQQLQSLSDLSLSGSQGPSSVQSTNQIWRPGY